MNENRAVKHLLPKQKVVKPKTVSMRFSAETVYYIDQIIRRYASQPTMAIPNRTEVVEFAVREVAKKLGIPKEQK